MAIYVILGIYNFGFFLWYAYAINRFVNSSEWCKEDLYCLHFFLAFLWPFLAAIYIPYRIMKAFGVKNGN